MAGSHTTSVFSFKYIIEITILIFFQNNDIITSKIMPCEESLSETCRESRLNNPDNVSKVNEHIRNLNQGKKQSIIFYPFLDQKNCFVVKCGMSKKVLKNLMIQLFESKRFFHMRWKST